MTGPQEAPGQEDERRWEVESGENRQHSWRFPRESDALPGTKVETGLLSPAHANPGADAQLPGAESKRLVWEE